MAKSVGPVDPGKQLPKDPNVRLERTDRTDVVEGPNRGLAFQDGREDKPVTLNDGGPGAIRSTGIRVPGPMAGVEGHYFHPERTVGEGGIINSPLAPPWPSDTAGIERLLREDYPLVPGLPDAADKVQRAAMDKVAQDPRAFAKKLALRLRNEQQIRTIERNQKIQDGFDHLLAGPDAGSVPGRAAALVSMIRTGLPKELPADATPEYQATFEWLTQGEGADRDRKIFDGLRKQFRAGEAKVFGEALQGGLAEGRSLPAAVQGALDRIPVPVTVEVDGLKPAMSGDFAFGPRQKSWKGNALDAIDGTKLGAALFNTALHPAATLLSALVFEEVVNDAMSNPSAYGFEQMDRFGVAMMAGGVAAGKGFTAKNVHLPVQFIYDADGESNTTAFDGVRHIAQGAAEQAGREVDVKMVGVHTDPVAAYLRALFRSMHPDPSIGEGRMPGEVAIVSSHTDGVRNMRSMAQRMAEEGTGEPLILTNTTHPPKTIEPSELAEHDWTFESLRQTIFDITDHIREHSALPQTVKDRFPPDSFMGQQIVPVIEQVLADPKSEPMRNLVMARLQEDRHALENFYRH